MRFRPTRPLAATLAVALSAGGLLVSVAGPAAAADPTCHATQASVDGVPAFSVDNLPSDLVGLSGTLTLKRHDVPTDAQSVTVTGGSGATSATGTIADGSKVNPGVYDGSFTVTGQTPVLGATTTGTCSVTLTSTGPAPTGVTPSSFPQGSLTHDVKIAGTKFHPGTTVTGSNLAFTVTNVTGTQITGDLGLGQNAAAGAATLTVTNTDGTSATVPFTVAAGPKVTATSPTTVHRGTATTVTFTGTGLKNATLSIGDSSVGSVTNVSAPTDTSLSATITYNASITPGDHLYTIAATNGGSYSGKLTVTGELPTQPRSVKITPGTTTMDIAFAAPALDGGSPILDYTATINSVAGSSSQTASGSPIHVTGLLPGTQYSVTVVARNITGTGPATAPVKVKTKGKAPAIALSLSKPTTTSGTKITLKGVLPAGQFAHGDLVIVSSKIAGPGSAGAEGTGFVGQAADPSLLQFGVTDTGHFALTVQPYYNTCYTVNSGYYQSTICAHVITVTKSIAVVRSGNKLTITAQVGPGIHITKSSRYRVALEQVDGRGKVLKTLATVKPKDYRQAKGFGRLGANLVKFVITAPARGTRLVIVAVRDVLSTPKPSKVIVV
ncbi:MAG TPA: fibronectin type III domain-containing protein [Mycobacteriales bacterium]|nr:fibronectin type III domain-containing protein [Mycobacteriales bacterium]